MTEFLTGILDQVRSDIARPDYLDGLPDPPPARPASLRRAIEEAPGGWAVMVERKHRSPGAAVPELPERSLEEFVRAVSAARVDALSCLATRPGFGGSPREVHDVVRRATVPVLFKDFVLDPVQIEAARRAGASAILLIARLESEGRLSFSLRELAGRARAAGLEVLLEFHDADELKVAATFSADLYGVNVRDLSTLAMRPHIARGTFRALASHRPLLGLSGVEGPEEARRFRSWGADGLLIGSAFARSSHPEAFLESLRAVGAEAHR